MAGRTEPGWPVRIGVLAVVLAVIAVAGVARRPAPPSKHVLADIGGHSYDLTVADTEAARTQGLQGSDEPEASRGMLFVFDPPRPVNMLIKSLPYPVDVVFIGDDARVARTVSIQPLPMGIQAAPSGERVRYAIEVRRGTLAAGAITSGNAFALVGRAE